jgi:hypothetical protein
VKDVVLVQPVWHRVWQWPAVVNLITGGGAAGLYLMWLMAGAASGAGPAAAAARHPRQILANGDVVTALEQEFAAQALVLLAQRLRARIS